MNNILQSKKLKAFLLIFVCILLVMLIIFAIGSYRDSDTGSSNNSKYIEKLDKESLKTDDGEQVVLIPKEDIYSFSFTEASGIVLNFEYIDDQWVYTDNPDIDISEDRIDKVLNYLCDIRYVDTLAGVDGEGFGLGKGSKECRITDSAGSTVIISIGKINQKNGTVYFAINYDFSTVYINSGRLNKVTEYSIESLVQR